MLARPAGRRGDFAGLRRGAARTSCCSPAAPTAATARSCWRRPRARGGRVDRSGGGRRQRRRARRGRRRRSDGVPHVLADNVVPRIGVLAPGVGAGGDPRDVPGPRDRRQAPQRAQADFTAMVRGATPDVVLTGVELLARGLDDAHPAPATWSSSTSAARPPTCTRVVEIDPETGQRGRAVPRGRRDHAGHPDRRGRPGHALVGGHHGRGRPRLEDPGRRRPRRRRADPAPREPGFLPGTDAERDDDEAHRAGRGRASPCAGTPAGPGSWSAPRAASSSAPARTCARSACSSARAACCATAGRGVADRVLAGSTGERRRRRLAAARAAREVVVDADYVLAAAGLLAGRAPATRRTGWRCACAGGPGGSLTR